MGILDLVNIKSNEVLQLLQAKKIGFSVTNDRSQDEHLREGIDFHINVTLLSYEPDSKRIHEETPGGHRTTPLRQG